MNAENTIANILMFILKVYYLAMHIYKYNFMHKSVESEIFHHDEKLRGDVLIL